jgi:hypothetical protein
MPGEGFGEVDSSELGSEIDELYNEGVEDVEDVVEYDGGDSSDSSVDM